MAKTTDIEKEVKSVEEMLKEIRLHKHRIIEDFAKAYLAESELLPSEIEMVTQEIRNDPMIIEHKIFFRKKQP